MEREYAAFISYRHAPLDSAVAKALHSRIEQYRIPKDLRAEEGKKVGLVFRDQEELHASSDLTGEIREALENSEFLIVVCTENTAQSPWVSREIRHFLETHDRSRILTVLASGEPMDVFPRELTHIQLPDGTTEIVEPLAMDVRGRNIAAVRRKIRKEIPRLIAPILDCPYDALVLREQRRKFHRFVVAFSLILTVILSFNAVILKKNKEIARKNEELAAQKAQIQLRESELLTQDARESLEEGEILAAIEQSVLALPKAGDQDRPYYAPAEGVLMDAMNLFHTEDENYILTHRDLTQNTDISNFCISDDGKRIVTVDDYGMITCFDTETGQILWQKTFFVNELFYFNNHHVMIVSEPKIVLSQVNNKLVALDLETGNQIWEKEKMIEGFLFFHRENNLLAYVTHDPTGYWMNFADAQTGEMVSVSFLCEKQDYLYDFYQDDYYGKKELSKGGVFSQDGTCFYGAFFDNKILNCFRVDLTSGQCDIFYRYEAVSAYQLNIINMTLTDSTVRMIVNGLNGGDETSYLEIHQVSGELLCRWDVLPEGVVLSSETFAFLYDTHAVVGHYDHLILLDLETGEILDYVKMGSSINHMQIVENRLNFYLADGTTGLAWLDLNRKFAMTSDAFPGLHVELEKLLFAESWGLGIIQFYTEGDYFGIGVWTASGPGFTALVPEEKTNTVRIYEPILRDSCTELEPLQPKNDVVNFTYDGEIRRLGDILVVGPVQHPIDSTLKQIYLLDARSMEVMHTLLLAENEYYDYVAVLPDGSGYFYIDYEGIRKCDVSGKNTVYASTDDDDEILVEGQLMYVGNVLDSAWNYIAGDRELLVAWCNADTLTYWINDQEPVRVSLPEELIYLPTESGYATREMTVGENGRILISMEESFQDRCLSHTAVYDITGQTWTVFSQDFLFPDSAELSFSGNKPLMAWVDTDGILRIFDLEKGNLTAAIDLEIPADSVIQTEFIQDDSCILVKNQEGYLFIYDAATSELLLSEQLPSGSKIVICPDLRNQRLYLLDSKWHDINSLCVDMRSWSVLARFYNGIFFDPQSDKLYLEINNFRKDGVFSITVPTTEELVKTAMEKIQ